MRGVKKLLLVATIFLSSVSIAGAEVNLNISQSGITITGQDTFRINKVTANVDGIIVPGQYWIDFMWDSVTLVFVPINVGEENVATTALEGTWTGYEINGLPGWTAIVSGKSLEVYSPYIEWYKGTFTIMENAEPKEIDYKITQSFYSPYIGETALGIYKIEGKTLTMCFSEPSHTPRPSSFTPYGDVHRCYNLSK
jgi:uncharacterized protein (TIGR03067 family)